MNEAVFGVIGVAAGAIGQHVTNAIIAWHRGKREVQSDIFDEYRKIVDRLTVEHAQCQKDNIELRQENKEFRARIVDLERIVRSLQEAKGGQ